MGGGYLFAAAASVSYGSATVLQARGVALLAEVGSPGSRLRRLRAASLYAAGLFLDGAAFLMSVVALRTLPVFLVQALVCSSVAVTAVIAVPVLGAVLERQQVLALIAICAGLAVVATSAREGTATRIPVAARSGLLLAALPIVALLGVAARNTRRTRPVMFAVASGLAFAVVAIAARTLDLSSLGWHTMTDPAAWAVLVNGAIGAVAYGSALATGAITAVAAVTFTVETLLPAGVGMMFLGDQVRPGYGLLVWVGLLGTLLGAVILAREAGAFEREPERSVVGSDPGGT
jgi:drug/metabolite transporter (DMT)-like permease